MAKGVVYILIGILAVQAALSPAEGADGSGGALLMLLRQPFGRVMLALVALGLAGYVIWRLVQATLDPEYKGHDAKGVITRAGYLISAFLYGGVAVEAVRLLRGSGGGGDGDQQADHWTAMVMSQPFGRWAIAAVGAGVIIFGLYEAYEAFKRDFGNRINLRSLDAQTRERITQLGQLGLTARGLVFLMIGWFLIQAALQFDPEEARGLAGALDTIRQQSYGPYLLGLVALGLFAYGLFQIVKGRYRIVSAP